MPPKPAPNNNLGTPAALGRRMGRLAGVCAVVGSVCFARLGQGQTPLVCGQTLEGNIGMAGQIDTNLFSGSAGEMVTVAFYWGCSGGSGSADIYFPGATVASTNLKAACGASAVSLTLPASGTYRVLVHSSDLSSTGGYDLTIQSMSGGGCSGYTMNCGQTVEAMIVLPTQIDSYALVAGAGETVTLSDDGFQGLAVNVDDPSGSNVLNLGSLSSLNYTFTATGIYTILVHSDSYAGTGSYFLTMSPVIVGCATVPTVTVSPTNLSVASGSSATFTATASGAPPLFYQWLLGNDFIAGATNSSYVVAQAQEKDAGSYSVIVSNPGGAVTSAPPAVLSVFPSGPVSPVISWSNPPAITYGTALGGAQLDATANVPGSFAYSPAVGTVLNAGSNQMLSVLFTPNDASHYTTASASVNLTVLPASLTVRANNQSKTYGQTLRFAGTEFTASGLQNGDTIGSVTLTSSGAAATASVAGSPYSIVASAAGGGTFSAGNYAITYQNGALTVSPAPLTITANNTNKTYGQTLTLAGSQFTAAGLQNSETVGSVTLTTAGAVATAPAGNYAIIPSVATGGSFWPGNYSITYVDGLLTVSAPLVMLELKFYAGLSITGPIGAQYAIQAAPATNATAWTTLTNVTLASPSYVYIDLTSPTNVPEVYRAVPLP